MAKQKEPGTAKVLSEHEAKSIVKTIKDARSRAAVLEPAPLAKGAATRVGRSAPERGAGSDFRGSNPSHPGRKSKISPEIIDLLYREIANGASEAAAAKRAGISYRTFHNWIKRGEKELRGLAAQFPAQYAARYERARAQEQGRPLRLQLYRALEARGELLAVRMFSESRKILARAVPADLVAEQEILEFVWPLAAKPEIPFMLLWDWLLARALKALHSTAFDEMLESKLSEAGHLVRDWQELEEVKTEFAEKDAVEMISTDLKNAAVIRGLAHSLAIERARRRSSDLSSSQWAALWFFDGVLQQRGETRQTDPDSARDVSDAMNEIDRLEKAVAHAKIPPAASIHLSSVLSLK